MEPTTTTTTEPDHRRLSDATARLIREQVRAVMHEEIQMHGTSPRQSRPQKQDAPPPPAYTSDPGDASRHDAPGAGDDLLHSEAAHLLAADPLGDGDDIEASAAPNAASGPWPTTRFYWALPGPLRFVLIMLPFVSVFVLLGVFLQHGDVLGLSAVAFFLILSQLVVLMITIFISTVVVGHGGTEPSKPTKESNEGAAMTVSLFFLLSWLVFFFIMWRWLVAGQGAMVHRFQLAADFDAKITQHDALGSVTRCIQEIIPHRNATIDDFTFCFRRLGMPKTVIP